MIGNIILLVMVGICIREGFRAYYISRISKEINKEAKRMVSGMSFNFSDYIPYDEDDLEDYKNFIFDIEEARKADELRKTVRSKSGFLPNVGVTELKSIYERMRDGKYF